MPASETTEFTDFIVPQTVIAAPTITEGGGNSLEENEEPIAPAGKLWFALLVGTFDVVGIVMVTAQFSHPTWMTVLGIGGTIAATAGVGFLLTRGRPRPRPDPA